MNNVEEILMAIRAQLEDIQARIKRMEDQLAPPIRAMPAIQLPAFPATHNYGGIIPLTASQPIPGWTKTDWDVT